MESERLTALLDELDKKLAHLKQMRDALKHEPDFSSLESLVEGHQKHSQAMQTLASELAALEAVRPDLVAAIESAQGQEAEAEQEHLEAEAGKEIRKTLAELDKVDPCTVKQTRQLVKLSKLMEVMYNEKQS